MSSKSSNVTSSSSSSSASATSSSNKSTTTLTQLNNTNIQQQQQQQQMPHLITTTEEEFESMENAVNNLLVSKKQIDALNSERISLIRIYESKLAEQNAQINYLNEENCKLKSIINSIKCQNSPKSTSKVVEETSTKTTTSKNNQRLALQSFDLCLDNLIRQLLNSLKIQETIRVEYLRQSSSNKNSNSCFDKTNVNQLICTSDSWTFNQQDQHHRKEPLHQKDDDHIKSISGSTESSCDGENNSNTSANSKPNIIQYQYPQDSRFHELLLKQQRQQLSILSELNKISKSLKSDLFEEAAELLDEYEFDDNANNEEEEEEDSIDNNNVSWFSNLESSSGASIEQNQAFTKSTIIVNNHHSHSENIEKREEEMPTMSGGQNEEEPSKCHIYTKMHDSSSSSHKTTTIIQVNSPRKRIPEREQQIGSHQVARMSKIPVKIKDATTSVTTTKSGGSIQSTTSPTTSKSSFRSRIPQPSTNSKQHCEANKYNTYTKNKTTKQQQTTQAVVNSATFDKPAPLKGVKLECSNEVTILLTNPTSSEVNIKQQLQPKSNMVDIVLVPVGKLDEDAKTTDTSVVVENKSKETSSRVKKREDEGYSTMSSELMHQIRVNPANSSNGSRPAGQFKKGRSKKRYCFPTLKSFSYYYNNRYYHQYHQEEAAAIAATTDSQRSDNRADEFDYLDERVCCKYLSDTDIAALINQLSSYDKDLSYNVFHLDTLYSNVDYILFNSYASDTELVYNSNRRNLRNQHFLNSNYKLYINDYFNQPYEEEEEEEEDEDDEDEVDEEEADNSDGILVRDEELERENMSDCNMIELSVDGEEVDEADGLVYDDDYNMLMMIKTSKSCENPRVREVSKSMDDFKLSEYKQYLLSDDQSSPPPLPPPIFASHTSLYLNTTSGTTAASSSTSSSSSNSCDCCDSSSSNSTDSLSSSASSSTTSNLSHNVLSSPQLSSLSSSLSSPASTRNNRRRHRDTKVKARSSRNKNSRRRHRHHCHRHRHRRHRKHEYFTDSIENKHNGNSGGGNFFEKCTADDDICDAFEETNDFFIDKFELEDFVAKLNMQCKMDKTIAANEKTSKQLKELNMLAAKAMEAASGKSGDNRNDVLEDDSDDLDDIIGPMLQISRGKPPPVPPQSKPAKNSHSLIRRHTITSMPISAAGLETAAASTKPFCESSPRSSVANTPVKTMDSRAYVGSFNRSNYENHQNQAIPSSVNSTPCRRSSFNTTASRIHGSHSKLISTSPPTAESPEIAQLPNSPMHQARPMSNNFNTDFYRLCSDTLYYYGSDANLNPIPSPTHHQYLAPMLTPQPTNNLELIKEANSSLLSQQETDFPTIDRPESCSNTLTAHVNSLFDQWLLNSGARK